MADELQVFVKKLLPTVEGLESIVVSDRDGVTLVEARSGSVPSATIKPPFLGIFSIASEQASKLGLGKNKGIISYYSGHQVVQFNYFPLVLTFIAHTDANTGLIYSLEEEMREAVGDLQSTSGSDSLQTRSGSLRRTRSKENANSQNITEQVHLLLKKIIVLEQKLKSMEMQLKNEQVQRLNLEASIVKLEKENESLKLAQSKAHKQLQNFADKFYAETEGISVANSHPSSPQSSTAELRTLSRNDSVSSNISGHSKSSET